MENSGSKKRSFRSCFTGWKSHVLLCYAAIVKLRLISLDVDTLSPFTSAVLIIFVANIILWFDFMISVKSSGVGKLEYLSGKSQ